MGSNTVYPETAFLRFSTLLFEQVFESMVLHHKKVNPAGYRYGGPKRIEMEAARKARNVHREGEVPLFVFAKANVCTYNHVTVFCLMHSLSHTHTHTRNHFVKTENIICFHGKASLQPRGSFSKLKLKFLVGLSLAQ